VLVSLQPRGEKLLEKVVAQRLVELRSHGRALVESIGKLLESRTISGRQKNALKGFRPRYDSKT